LWTCPETKHGVCLSVTLWYNFKFSTIKAETYVKVRSCGFHHTVVKDSQSHSFQRRWRDSKGIISSETTFRVSLRPYWNLSKKPSCR